MSMRAWVGCLLCCVAGMGMALDPEHELLMDRIQPLGAVRVKGGEVAQAAPAEPSKPNVRTGEQIYQQYCHVCHATGVAGAPKFRDQQDWHERLTKKGIDGLIKSVTNGFNAMPPMGTCQDCSAEDFKHAIEYMLPR